MMARTRSLRERFFGQTRPIEFLVRNILALGFLIVLLLVVGVGYRSIQSLEQLEKESRRVDETEELRLRIALAMAETAGKIVTEARAVIASRPNRLLETPAAQRLKQLRREMDLEINEAQKTSLVDSAEWQSFETSYERFWEAMDKSGPASDEWLHERNNMLQSVTNLQNLMNREREQNNIIAHEMSVSARRRIVTATGAVLLVGIVVAVLAFYEIRKNLSRLGDAYAASAQSRDYLQSLLDSLVAGVVVIGQDGAVQTVSESFKRLPGADADSGIGQAYTTLFRNNPSLLAAVSQELSEPTPGTHNYGRVDLGLRLFDVFTSPLIVAGERHGVILVFVDVTDATRAQSELRRNRALTAVGQMTAQIAHEIKNPLGSIRFAAELLKRQRPTIQTDALSTIQVIERSVDHLATICAELSEFARPKKLNRSETNLNKLLEDLLPMVADRLTSRQIQIARLYDSDIPAGYYDVTELKKLFLNLIINAVEASEPGGGIELRTRFNGDQDVLIDIVDRGSGMDPETQKRLFEPFYTTKEKGTGLGMAIAKQIAELHSGDLTVVSKAGAGTTATVRLPLTKFVDADNRIGAVNRLSI
jgi:two-component system, NtrC family, nitrogen regulation sensor histidine kinase GlnL